MFSAYEFRQFAQNPPHERPQERRRARMRILQCAPNNAPAECLLPVNFGLRLTANSQADRNTGRMVMGERLNLRLCRHALRCERGAVHAHDLELVGRPAMLNVREV